MKRRSQTSPFKVLIMTALWVAMMYFLAKTLGEFPTSEIWKNNLKAQHILGLAGYLFCFIVAYTLRAWRFGFLMRLSAVDLSWREIIRAFPYLFFLGAITPMRLGEAYRAIWIKEKNGSSGDALGYWIAERVTDILVLLSLLLFAISQSPISNNRSIFFVTTAILSSLILCYGILWTFYPVINRHIKALGLPVEIYRIFEVFKYMSNIRVHAYVFLSTLLIWTISILGFWLALRSFFGSELNIGFVIASATLSNFAAVVSVAPANVGGFQAGFVGAAAWFLLSSETAFVSSVYMQAIALVFVISVGILSFLLNLLEKRRNL